MSYPAWWNKTVTIYNRFEDKDGYVTWHKNVLSGCFVKTTPTFVVSGDVGTEKTQTIIRIRKSERYVYPVDWATDANKRKSGFTVQNGDIIVVGNISDIIDEYENGKRSDDLINKYKSAGSITVNSFSENTFGALAHYKAVGV